MKSKLKRHFVRALAGFLFYSGLIRLWMRFRYHHRRGSALCVLGLHRVLSHDELQRAHSLPGIILRQGTFEAVVRYLQTHFSIISLQAFLSTQATARSDSRLPCLLTFDDGWRDNFTTALPILKKYNAPAVIFAVSGLVETPNTFWVENLAKNWKREDCRRKLDVAFAESSKSGPSETTFEGIVEKLKHLPAAKREQVLDSLPGDLNPGESMDDGDRMFSWSEAKDLQKEGVEIEAHSVTHPLLVYEDDETVVRELSESKRLLEQKLGKRVRAFAYPNGTWDQRVRKMVEEAGYECAFTTEKGWHHPGADRFAIRRIMLHEGMVTGPNGKFSPALLSLRLSGLI